MKAKSVRIFFGTAIFILWPSNENCVQGQTQTTVSVSPSPVSVRPGAIAELDIRVADAVNLFAASVALTFDETVLHYEGVSGGSFLTEDGRNSIFLGIIPYPPPPSAPVKIIIDQAIIGGGTVSGSGALFTIRFKGLRASASAVTVVLADLRDGSNAPMPVQIESGRIIVNNPPAAVNLLSPSDGRTIDTAIIVVLRWSESIDADTDDVVKYEVHLTSADTSLCFGDLTATSITLAKSMLKSGTDYTWYVDATDGIDTTSSVCSFAFKTPITSGLNRYRAEIRDGFEVEGSYPNPFNSLTVIRFSTTISIQVSVTIFDITGREIMKLMGNNAGIGHQELIWNGKNSSGVTVGSGTYLYLVIAGKRRIAGKIILLR